MCLGADLHVIFPNQISVRQSKSQNSLSQDHACEQDEISNAGINGEIWGDGQGKETNKALMAPDRLRITLTHGSILVISGIDIDVRPLLAATIEITCLMSIFKLI